MAPRAANVALAWVNVKPRGNGFNVVEMGFGDILIVSLNLIYVK